MEGARGLLDSSLIGDDSSNYTMAGALDGPNSMVMMPAKKSKVKASGVVKVPSKRSLRAQLKQREKERMKRINKEICEGIRQISPAQDSAIRMLSVLLDKSLPNEKFEELYTQVANSGAKIPDQLVKRHLKIQKVLSKKAAQEDLSAGEDEDF